MQQDFAASNFIAQSEPTNSLVHSNFRVDKPLAYLHSPAMWQAERARHPGAEAGEVMHHRMSQFTPQVAPPLHAFAKL